MAKEGQRSAAADKGKGKADDVRELNGQKKDAEDDKSSKVGNKENKDDELQEGKLATRSTYPLFICFGVSGLLFAVKKI